MFGDDLMDIKGTKSCSTYQTTCWMTTSVPIASTIAVMPVPHDEVSAYGVIARKAKERRPYSVETRWKPAPDAPSDLAIIGRHLLPIPKSSKSSKDPSSRCRKMKFSWQMQSIPHKTQRVFAEFKGLVTMSETSLLYENPIDYASNTHKSKTTLKDYLIQPRKRVSWGGIEEYSYKRTRIVNYPSSFILYCYFQTSIT